MNFPHELIAQHPAQERTASRLLHLDGASGALRDLAFADLPALVDARDALVLNDTRVIKARLHGRKSTRRPRRAVRRAHPGEREALALMRTPGIRSSRGTGSRSATASRSRCSGARRTSCRVRFAEPVAAVLERCGSVPLPPYITPRRPAPEDAERYQTVYAEQPGAVAAPTAGLHFDQEILQEDSKQRHKHCKNHPARRRRHLPAGARRKTSRSTACTSERYAIPPETLEAIAGRRVLAVGTTTLRALETQALTGKREGETDLFIYPGFKFRVVDRLLTNFHLPKSSLLMLVAAFAGLENIRKAYAHAIEQQLPVLLLRRCHADREGRVKFSCHATATARRGAACSSSRTARSTRRSSCRWAPTAR